MRSQSSKAAAVRIGGIKICDFSEIRLENIKSPNPVIRTGERTPE